MTSPLVAEGAAMTAFRSVMLRVHQAAERSGSKPERVRVVAVSKTKPVTLIQQLYDAGHRYFGENYVQEIIEKAPQLPQDVEWHFIGHLQSNKVKTLLGGVPNLAMVQSVDNQKVANHLDRMVSTLGRNPLKVLVQVNTSGEESKSGIDPSNCVELAKHVKLSCPNLVYSGLMTIGMPDYTSTPQNFQSAFYHHFVGFVVQFYVPCIQNSICLFIKVFSFVKNQSLSNCRTEVCKALEMPEEECELSMGMSGDFELAIEMGSTNVRIGSTIFGPREYAKKQ
ncbi:Pyridoxal phosphate homeostasis protein [Glycine max]|nr:Pyridoxal phosphate homeostasis protein [Glycine max]